MGKLRKNLFGIFWGMYAALVNCPHVMANNTDIVSFQGGGSLNNVDVFRIDSSGNVFISSYNASNFSAVPHTTITNQGLFTHSGDVTITNLGDVNFGALTVAQTTATTTGAGQGNVYTAFLSSGPASGSGISIPAVEGSVLCATTTQQNQQITLVVCPPAFNLNTWVGVADAAASTGTIINVLSAGAWALAQTTGTVNAGDSLFVSALSTGVLQSANANATFNAGIATMSIVATALAAGNSNGGLLRVRLR